MRRVFVGIFKRTDAKHLVADHIGTFQYERQFTDSVRVSRHHRAGSRAQQL
jgi:hypothetical protein